MSIDRRKYINGWTIPGNKIKLLYSDDGKKKIEEKKVDWYFYVADTKKNRDFLRFYFGAKYNLRVKKSDRYLKVTDLWDRRFDLFNELTKAKIQTYEADLSPLDLHMLDSDFEVEDNYRILYFDIETDDSNPEIVVGKYRILSIGCYDNEGKKLCIVDDSESTILKRFCKILEKYDVIVGWNSDNFDLPYLKERLWKHRLNYDFNRVIHVDLMKRFIKIGHYKFDIENYKLNTIANYFIGESKVDREGSKIIDLFNNDRETLIKYNLKDCEILYKLDKAMNALSIMILEAKWCKTFLREFYVSKLLDMYILNEARKKGIHYRTKDHVNNNDSYIGALVFEPEKGIFKNVYVCDFKSLYPSIIMTFNISPDVLQADEKNSIKTVNGLYYSKIKDGLITTIMVDLLNKRQAIKKLMKNHSYRSKEYEAIRHQQDAVKELANSIYGILGDSRTRYYNPKAAEAITLAGQWLTKMTKSYLKTTDNMDVVYGDTDSVFVHNAGELIDTDKMINGIQEHLERKLIESFDINKSYIQLEYEKLLEKVFFVSKKRYAQKIIEVDGKKTDYIEIVGLECRKSDTVRYAKRLQKHLIESILNETMPLDIKYHDAWLKDMLSNFLNSDIPVDDIIIRQKITKKPDEYKTELAHVKIAKDIIKNKEEFYIGMSVEYIVKQSSPKLVPCRPHSYDGTFDRFYYWNNRIFPLLERVYETIMPESNWKIHYISKDVEAGQLTFF